MKQIILFAVLLLSFTTASAQREVAQDSVRLTTPEYRQFGEFILDLGLMKMPELPRFNPDELLIDVTKDYNMLFRMNSSWMVTQAPVAESYYYAYAPGLFGSTQNMMVGTFKLNDKLQLSLYGQYDMRGNKIPNTSAYPWEKKMFRGGFELKINNTFGIRMEVKQGYDPMFPY